MAKIMTIEQYYGMNIKLPKSNKKYPKKIEQCPLCFKNVEEFERDDSGSCISICPCCLCVPENK